MAAALSVGIQMMRNAKTLNAAGLTVNLSNLLSHLGGGNRNLENNVIAGTGYLGLNSGLAMSTASDPVSVVNALTPGILRARPNTHLSVDDAEPLGCAFDGIVKGET